MCQAEQASALFSGTRPIPEAQSLMLAWAWLQIFCTQTAVKAGAFGAEAALTAVSACKRKSIKPKQAPLPPKITASFSDAELFPLRGRQRSCQV